MRGALKQLLHALLADCDVDLAAKLCHLRIQMSFRLQLDQDFGCKLIIALLKSFLGALDAGTDSTGIERIDGFAATGFLQRLREFAGRRKSMPGLLGHGLMKHPADALVHVGVDIGGRRRDLVHDCFDDLPLAGALERAAAREHLIGHHAQREDVGQRRRRLHLEQLRRHEQQGPLLANGSAGAGHVGDAEIDDLHRIVRHHKDIAGLEVAMYQASLMRRAQAAADLCKDINRAFDGQLARALDQPVERRAG